MIHEIKYFQRERSAYYVTIIINFRFSRYFSSKMNVRIFYVLMVAFAAHIRFETLEMRRRLWSKYHRLAPSAPTKVNFKKSTSQNTPKFRKRSSNYSTGKLCQRFLRNDCIFQKTVLKKAFWNKYYLAHSHKSPILQNLMS